MKFSKKTAHRLIVSLAMLAPVIYLFGAMFLGLAGAHGEHVFAQTEYLGPSPISISLVEGDISLSTGVFYEGESSYTCSDSINVPDGTESISVLEPSSFEGSWGIRIYTYSESGYLDTFVDNDFPVQFGIAESVKSVRFRFYFYNAPLKSSNIVFNGALSFYDSVAYNDYVFGQFFPHDNFLERVGVNALSANPIGFAPFGTFLSYLDVNVFHAANSQMALMLYGMVYWSLHVVIADLVYHVAVFIPNIIQRVFDWFGQKGLEDD